MKKILALSALILISSISFPAFALTLSEARDAGLVGEKGDGYIAAVSTATPEVAALVESVNKARKEEYQSISKNNGQPLNVVETLAGEKIISEKLKAGNLYQSGGKWLKR